MHAACADTINPAAPFKRSRTSRRQRRQLRARAGTAGGKKAKKAGKGKRSAPPRCPALTPQHVAALRSVTGALKILTTENMAMYRVARVGGGPCLLALREHSDLVLRRNSVTILGAGSHAAPGRSLACLAPSGLACRAAVAGRAAARTLTGIDDRRANTRLPGVCLLARVVSAPPRLQTICSGWRRAVPCWRIRAFPET